MTSHARKIHVLCAALSMLGAGLAVRSTMQNHLRANLAIGDASPGF